MDQIFSAKSHHFYPKFTANLHKIPNWVGFSGVLGGGIDGANI